MSMRAWAIRPSELKTLDAGARVQLLVRWVKRVEPWVPQNATAHYRKALALIEEGQHDEALAGELEDLGAIASHQLDGTGDEALGRCHNYATLVASCALKPTATKDLVLIAKYIGSIPAMLGHAGKTKEPVEVVAVEMWNALRSDIALVRRT